MSVCAHTVVPTCTPPFDAAGVCVCVCVCVERVTDTGLCRGVSPISGDFDMIKEGDRLLLGLSGGKDSMSLLHCLLDFQRRSRVKFQLGCVTVDPQSPGFQPGPLREYVARCVRSDSLLRKRVHALLSTPCARVQDVCETSGKVCDVRCHGGSAP